MLRRLCSTRSSHATAPLLPNARMIMLKPTPGHLSKSGVSSHSKGKASGRKAALDSPLYYYSEKTDEQQSDNSYSSPTLSFGSTHNHRRFQPRNDDGPTSQKASASVRDGGDHAAAPLVAPQSSLAYRARLQQARVENIMELVQTPYAPPPLQVLEDVLTESARLQAWCHVKGQMDKHKIHGNDQGDGRRDALALLTSEQNCEEEAATLKQLQNILSKSVDVAMVLRCAEREVAEIVRAADVVGDRGSMHQLRHAERGVTHFTDVLRDFCDGTLVNKQVQVLLHGGEEGGENSNKTDGHVDASWSLPDGVHAELLRGTLVLGKLLGNHLVSVDALNELVHLSESVSVRQASSCREDGEDEDDDMVIDDIVSIVSAEVQSQIRPVSAMDHLQAMESCTRSRQFEAAFSLYKRFCQHAQSGAFAVSQEHLAQALTTLAHCSRTSVHFAQLQTLIIESDAASTVPVSVPLYTALIDAVSRSDTASRMPVALSLYRRLRDTALTPTVDTYAALMACCASTAEPTHAFAFYHEARQICGVSSFTPQLYTNLLLSYANARLGADARRTLDVLVEAGAPLTRASFHAVLSCTETLREAQEVLDMMQGTYHIQPTPHTYAFLVQAASKAPSGVRTALQVFDYHEAALSSLNAMASEAKTVVKDGERVAVCTSNSAVNLEQQLLETYPMYVRSLEHSLMRLRLDPTMDPRLQQYLKPLLRVAQQRMNAFTEMPPQAPTRIPDGVSTCVVVLGPDVLAHIDEWVIPFVSYYSAIVIPYSALLALQLGKGKRVEGLSVPGVREGLYDDVWQDVGGSEHDAMVEHRRRRLVKFLKEYRDVIHLVSLEEELRYSRDTNRYGISPSDWSARCAALAIHWARPDTTEGEAPNKNIYAANSNVQIVVSSANFHGCGRYIVDLKSRDRSGRKLPAALQQALRRVVYHNPRTQPNWVPPSLSINPRTNKESPPPQQDASRRSQPASAALPRHEADALYREQLQPEASQNGEGSKDAGTPNHFPAADALHADSGIDADLLMMMMDE